MKKIIFLLAILLFANLGFLRAQTKSDCSDVIIGTGTIEGALVPFCTWEYAYTQQIYTAAEIGFPAGGTINSLSVQYTNNTLQQTMIKPNQTVYIGNTSKSSFSSTTDWIAVGELQQVYQGTISFAHNPALDFWVTIEFDTPFEYTGGNLVVACLNNHGAMHAVGATRFLAHTEETSKTIQYQSGTSGGAINPAAPPTAVSLPSIRGNMRFNICPAPAGEVCNDVPIGNPPFNGIATSPFSTMHRYSYCQQLFTPEEIGIFSGEATITSVSFQYLHATACSRTNLTIYMAHTDKEAFTQDAAGWVPGSQLQQVFTGTLSFNNSKEWYTIEFQTPFTYTGGNLVIAYVNNSNNSSATPTGNVWNRHATTTPVDVFTSLVWYSNGTASVNINTPPTNSNVSTQTSFIATVVRANTMFNICAAATGSVCNPATDLAVSYTSECAAELTWTAPSAGATYNIYRDDLSIATNVTSTTYTDTGFDVYAAHTWTVKVVCGSEESEAATVTEPACSTPSIVCEDVPITIDAPPFYALATIPISTMHRYSYCQQIFTPEEIGIFSGEATITSVSLQYVSVTACTKPITIYMAHTDKEVFTKDASSWVPGSQLQQVFTGTLNFNNFQEWFTIEFQTPFTYTGGNLVIAYVNNHNNNSGPTSNVWNRHITTDMFRTLIWYSNGTASVNINNPPFNENTTTQTSFMGTVVRSNTMFNICAAGTGSVCNPVTDLAVNYTSECAAELTWIAPTAGATYNIYRDDLSIATNVTSTTYTDTGFDVYEEHTWAVKVVCGSEESEAATVTEPACSTPAIVCEDVSIGNPPFSALATSPFSTIHRYSYCQQLFTPEEIGIFSGEATITSVSLQYVHATACSRTNLTIYMAHTDKEEFTQDAAGWVPGSQLQQVFTGTLNFNNSKEWYTIEFQTPFTYTGGNLVIAYVNNSNNSSVTPSGNVWNRHATTTPVDVFTSLLWYSNGTASVNINTPPTSVNSLTQTSFMRTVVRSNTMFNICAAATGSVCNPATDLAVNYTSECAAELTWTAPKAGATYNIYRDDLSIATNVTSTTYTDTGFDVYEEHTWAVKVICGSEESEAAMVTEAACSTPSIVCDDVTVIVDNGEANISTTPISTTHTYSYNQQIFWASEIGTFSGDATITSISYRYIHATPQTKNNITIYLGNTTQTHFIDASTNPAWIPVSEMQQVFAGTITFNSLQEWFTIEFQTPFTYTGGNVVVAILNNDGVVRATGNSFIRHVTPEHRAIAFCGNGAPISASNPPTSATGHGSGAFCYTTPVRSHIMFNICAEAAADDCVPTEVQAGANNTSNNIYCPVMTFYHRSYGQFIYDAVEIGDAGSVTSLSLNYNYSTGIARNNVTVYLGNTTKSEFAAGNASEFIPVSQLQTVFTGNLNFPAGNNWTKIEFDTPFNYTGDNLVVAILCNDTFQEGMFRFNNTNISPARKTLQSGYDGGAPLDPANPPTTAGGSVWPVVRPNMKFDICVGGTPIPVCNPATNLAVNYTSGCDAELTWTAPEAGAIYNIYRDDLLIESNVTSTTYTDTGFDITIEHTWAVKVVCGSQESVAVTVTEPACKAPIIECEDAIVDIQQGTIVSNNAFPVCTYRRYSYVQHIYTPDELGTFAGDATITSVSFQYVLNTAQTKNPVTIYLGHTNDKDRFTSDTDWIPLSQLQQVFTGSVTFNNSKEWFTIEFQTPFTYTGGHLVMAIVNNHGAVTTSFDNTFMRHSLPYDCSMICTRDGTTPMNPATPPTGSDAFKTPVRSHTMFNICSEVPTGDCEPPTNLVVNYTPKCTAAELTWDPPAGKGGASKSNVCTGEIAGVGTVATFLYPINLSYNRSYCQHLFKTGEIGAPGTITEIAFEYVATQALTRSNVTIYLGNTTKEAFGTNTDWVPVSQMTSVFTGTLNLNNSQTWFTITLNTPFEYTGGNLVLAVLNNHGSTTGSPNAFRVSAADANSTIIFNSDGATINPAGSLTASSRTTLRANTRFTVCREPGTAYNVYRNNVLIAPNVTETTYTDQDFEPSTGHKWAVTVACEEGGESVKIFASLPVCAPELCDPPSNLTATYDEDCNAQLSWSAPIRSAARSYEFTYKIYRGTQLLASNVTSTTYTDTGFDPSVGYTWSVITICEDDDESEPATVTLSACDPPCDPARNLVVNYNSNCAAQLTWTAPENSTSTPSIFLENVESHPNFAINSTVNGWSYIDGDGDYTWGLQVGQNQVNWPGAEQPHAFIVFNPSATSPSVAGQTQLAPRPGSGQKYFACFGVSGNYSLKPNNDDWIISRELTNPTTLSFWAKSHSSTYGLERMRVAYSTTGNAEADFTFIPSTTPYLTVPTTWTRYTYTLPPGTKHIAVNCISHDAFAFLLDDIEITSEVSAVRYNVYRDGELIAANIASKSYIDTDIEASEGYTWSVTAVCGDKESEPIAVIKPACEPMDYCDNVDIIIGNTASLPSFPLSTSNKYSYTQHIFTAEEIGSFDENMDITAVAFQYVFNRPNHKDPVTIYLGHTNQTEFASTNPVWIPITEMQQVFRGTVVFTNAKEWFTIKFDTPFRYTGGNLVIAVLNNDGETHTGYSYTFMRHTVDRQATLTYYVNGSTPINAANPPTTGSSFFSTPVRANAMFKICPVILDIDGKVVSIITPESGESLTATEEVKVSLKNVGSTPLTNFNLTLELDGALIATELYTGTIASMEEVEYIFTETLDLSAEGSYEITVTAVIAGDENLNNNSITKTVVNTIPIPEFMVTYNTPANGTLSVTVDGDPIASGTMVEEGTVLTITATPDPNYNLASLQVNGVNFTSGETYTVTSTTVIACAFTIKTYTITATPGANGTITPSGVTTVNHGATPAFIIAPNTGYHILSISVDGVDIAYTVNPELTAPHTYTFEPVTANRTIAATFALNCYVPVITFDKGIISVTPTTCVTQGSQVTFTITPDFCYDITEVILNGASVGTATTHPITINSKPTIEVSTQLRQYTITSTPKQGDDPFGHISPGGENKVNCGDDQDFIFYPIEGYRVSGVFVDEERVPTPTTIRNYTLKNVREDKTIRIEFEEYPYYVIQFGPHITLQEEKGGFVYPEYEPHAIHYVTVDSAELVYPFIIQAIDGFEIDQLFVDNQVTAFTTQTSNQTGTYVFTHVNSNHDIYATFKPIMYTIMASSDPNGNIMPRGAVQVIEGTNQTFYANPYEGYMLSAIIVDGDFNEQATEDGVYEFEDVRANHTIHAEFTKAKYLIKAEYGGGGKITPDSAWVEHGNNYTFAIIPDVGYKIDTVWVDDAENLIAMQTGAYTFVNVTEAHTITATFTKLTLTITATATFGGTIIPEELLPVAEVEYNTHSATYVFFAAEGYRIQSVLIDGKNDPVAVQEGMYRFLNVTENHTLHVVFVPDNFTINATATAGGSINPSGLITVPAFANKEFIFKANAGSKLARVMVNGIDQGIIESYTFYNVVANHTITAYFEKLQYNITLPEVVGATAIPAEGYTTTVEHGDKFVFTVKLEDGYTQSNITVRANGIVINALGGAYTINNIVEDQTITITGVTKNVYRIVARAQAGGTIAPSGTFMVAHNESMMFTMKPNANFEVRQVTVNGNPVTLEEDLIYTHTAIVDATIEVSFKPAGVNIDENEPVIGVYSYHNVVAIVNEALIPVKHVEIMDMYGRVVWKGQTTGERTEITLHVAVGLYTVRIHTEDNQYFTTKVVIN